jgi:hypothetical protein
MILSPHSILMIADERIVRMHAEADRRSLVALAREGRARTDRTRPHARRSHLATTIVALTLSLLACGPTEVRSVLTQAQATEMAEHALAALATGDYSGWSRNWSPSMKATVDEAGFRAFRDGVLDGYGRFVELESVQLVAGRSRGFVRWNAIARFERGRIQLGFGMRSDGTQIEGVFPEVLP